MHQTFAAFPLFLAPLRLHRNRRFFVLFPGRRGPCVPRRIERVAADSSKNSRWPDAMFVNPPRNRPFARQNIQESLQCVQISLLVLLSQVPNQKSVLVVT